MQSCNKRAYTSEKKAREAIKAMGNTVRVYFCPNCHWYHVTKEKYGKPQKNGRAWRDTAQRGRRHRRNGNA